MAKKPKPALAAADIRPVLADVQTLIRQTRAGVAQAVNSALVLLYWHVGPRSRTEILGAKRTAYGEQICSTLSNKLAPEFGAGFSRPNLTRMIQFAEAFPDRAVVATLARNLGWSHVVEILPLKDDLSREFYAAMCQAERWSVRALRDKIQGMLFERTALSKKPADLARRELAALQDADRLSPDLVFRDPKGLPKE